MDVHAYTEEVVFEKLQNTYSTFLVRQTAGRRVDGQLRLVNRAESATEEGGSTYFKIYTAIIGRLGVAFVLKGPDQDALAALEPQFDALVAGVSLPSPAPEVPDLAIIGQAVGLGYSDVTKAPTDAGTVFYPDTPALYAAFRFDSLGADSQVDFRWFRVDRFNGVVDVLDPIDTGADAVGSDEVYWSSYTPEDGMEPGFYLIGVAVDGAFVDFAHYSVVIEDGNEYADAQTFEDWAIFLLLNDDPVRAVYAATRAIQMDPEAVQAYIWRAEAYEAQCKIRPALADHAVAVELLPDNPVTVATRGHAHWYAFDFEEALRDHTRALALLEDLPRETERQQLRYATLKAHYYNVRALVHVDLNRIGEALADVEEALKIGLEEYRVYYLDTIGYAYLHGGRLAEAEEAYDAALAQDFESAYVYFGLGLTKYLQGDRDAARAHLEKGMALFAELSEHERTCPDPQLSRLRHDARVALGELERREPIDGNP